MQATPEGWTDDRLDDLRARVETGLESTSTELRAFRIESRTESVALRSEMKAGFDRVDDEFTAVRREMKEGFGKVDERFERLEEKFDRVDERFEAVFGKFEDLNRTIIASCLSLILALVIHGVFLH